MNARTALALLAVAAAALLLALPAHGQTGILIDNADTVREEVVNLDSNLLGAAGRVSPRVVLQFANTKRQEPIVAPPADLQTQLALVLPRVVLQYANSMRQEQIAAPPADLQILFGQVSARIVLQYANTMRQAALAAPPGDLSTLFSQVAQRIILQYANTSRQVPLTYPREAIGDTIPPQIRDVRAQNVAGGVKITWTTDEFATSYVRYGTESGTYRWTAGDPLYEKQHAVAVTDLQPGKVYYYVVISIDLGGNEAMSAEYRMQSMGKAFLPALLRRHTY